MACISVPGKHSWGNPFSRGKAPLDCPRATGTSEGAFFLWNPHRLTSHRTGPRELRHSGGTSCLDVRHDRS
jgi:hypothetical protein